MIDNFSKVALAGISIVSLVGLSLKFLNNSSKNKSRQPKKQDSYAEQQRLITQQLDHLNHLQQILSRKAEELEISYLTNLPHVLTSECLKEIMQFTPEIIDLKQLNTIYQNSRKARRSCFKQIKNDLGQGQNPFIQTYYRFVCTFEEELQYLIEKAQKDFIIFFGIDYLVVTDSIDYHISISQGNFVEWIQEWGASIKDQLKQKLPLYNKPLPPAQIMAIVQAQIDFLLKNSQNFRKTIFDLHLQDLDQTQAVPTFLQCFIEDLLEEEFKVEIQQVNLSSEDLTPELSEKMVMLREIQSSVLQKMQDLESSVDDGGQCEEEITEFNQMK